MTCIRHISLCCNEHSLMIRDGPQFPRNFELRRRICPFPQNFYVFTQFCGIRWPVMMGQIRHIWSAQVAVVISPWNTWLPLGL